MHDVELLDEGPDDDIDNGDITVLNVVHVLFEVITEKFVLLGLNNDLISRKIRVAENFSNFHTKEIVR